MPPKLVLEEAGDAIFKEVSVDEAASKILDGKLQVVDVRDDGEYSSGHIKGSKHVPWEDLVEGEKADANVSKLLDQLKADGTDHVLIVCMYSSGRGPTVAQRLTSFAEAHNMALDVCILDGGFHGFVNKARGGGTDSKVACDLLEGYKPEHWCETPNRGLVTANAVDAMKELEVDPVPEDGTANDC
mmetsp:Transcript_57059/g.121249  ORF Transcript_57059/g.121249 Transcript_57059/m.121249 type:complete len:186 (-) Transcript_57059:360-917(-)